MNLEFDKAQVSLSRRGIPTYNLRIQEVETGGSQVPDPPGQLIESVSSKKRRREKGGERGRKIEDERKKMGRKKGRKKRGKNMRRTRRRGNKDHHTEMHQALDTRKLAVGSPFYLTSFR